MAYGLALAMLLAGQWDHERSRWQWGLLGVQAAPGKMPSPLLAVRGRVTPCPPPSYPASRDRGLTQ